MKILKSLSAGSLVFAFAAGACGNSSNSEDLSHLTPAELCQRKCDLEVAGNCEKTPPDYASSCALICQAKYDKFPNCTAASRAQDTCAIQRVHYGCESGVISVMPTGACASEAAACLTCTGGDITNCL